MHKRSNTAAYLDLPRDVFYDILSYLNVVPDFFRLFRVSKWFREVIVYLIKTTHALDLSPLYEMTRDPKHLEKMIQFFARETTLDNVILISEQITALALALEASQMDGVFSRQLTIIVHSNTTPKSFVHLQKLCGFVGEETVYVNFYRHADSFLSYRIPNNQKQVLICCKRQLNFFPIKYHIHSVDELSLEGIEALFSRYSILGNQHISQLPKFDPKRLDAFECHKRLYPILQNNFYFAIVNALSDLRSQFSSASLRERNFKKLYESWYNSKTVQRSKQQILRWSRCVSFPHTYQVVIEDAKRLDDLIEQKRQVSRQKCKVDCSWFMLLNSEMKKNLHLKAQLWRESQINRHDQ